MAKSTAIDSDKTWQARCDASTLAEAKTIMTDPKRLTAAAKAAKKLADDKHEEAKAMSQVARKAPKSSSKPAAKSHGKKK